MGKKHDTFPGEQPEMPVPHPRPEVNQPSDPDVPKIPQEDPQQEPEELPPAEHPQDPALKTPWRL